MKKTVSAFIVICVFLFGGVLYLGYQLKENVGTLSFDNISRFIKGEASVQIDSSTKEQLKEGAGALQDKIYEESVKYNPEGDVVPDEWDDQIKEKIKEEAKKRLLEKGQEATEQAINEEINQIVSEK